MRLLIPFFLAIYANCFGQTSLSCISNGATNTPVRHEGLTELIGDFVVVCTGGVPTPPGTPIPTVDIQVFLNTPATSRCLESAVSTNCIGLHSEALLILDEPIPATQYGCPTNTCANVGTGTGAGGYGPGAAGLTGNNKNIFQGIQTALNSITFAGIPIDPPGTGPARIIRITNVRADANFLDVAPPSSAPTYIAETISATPFNRLPIVGLAVQAVGSVLTGASVSVISPVIFQQDTSQNAALAVDPNSNGVSQFSVRFRELFSTAFNKRNIAMSAADPTALADQDDLMLGTYSTESGFYKSSLTIPASLRPAGVADSGTRLMARFFQVPAGVSLFAKVSATVTGGGPGVVRMVSADANGAGPHIPVTGNAFGIAPLPIVNGAATAVYEVVEANPNSFATVDIPIYVAYTSNVAMNSPGLGAAIVGLTFGPLSAVAQASGADPVPRFADTASYQNAFSIQVPVCTTLGSSTASFGASGGPGSAAVTAPGNCQWLPYTTDNWITVAPSGVLSGNGTVNYTVAANPNTSPRTGTIFLNPGIHLSASEYLTINQSGLVCAYGLSLAPGPFVSTGGTGSFTVIANSTVCGWTAVSNSSWISVTSGNTGNGSGAVGYSVDLNTGPARTGTISIAGQTFTINQQGLGQNTPSPVFLNSSSGSGYSQTFAFTFSDPDGWQDLGVLNVLVNNFLDGRQACYIAYLPSGPASGTVLLVDDAGNAGGPFASLLLPGAGSISNGQCTIAGTGSSVSGIGNALTLTLKITFNPTFVGNKVINMAARDAASHNSGWQSLGVWNIPGPEPTGPAVGGVTPARADTATQTYTFTFTDANGYSDLTVLNVLVNRFIDGRNGCYVAYVPTGPTTGTVLLVNDAGAAGGPFQSLAIGTSGVIQNSQCTISGPGSSATGSGTTRTLTLPITFSPDFAGSQVLYVAARSDTQTSGWQAVGSVTVP